MITNLKHLTFDKAKAMNMNRLAAAVVRSRFLFEWIDSCLDEGGDLALIWAAEALAEVEYLQSNCFYEPAEKMAGSTLTREEIKRAREYPVDKLIDFDRAGRATAWCHDDKKPSLTLNKRHNRAHCFCCATSFNPIDIRMHHADLPFYEAVRSLL